MDEDRRRQIEEEERYRSEVRAKLEREQSGTAPPSREPQARSNRAVDPPPLAYGNTPKQKRGGGCLRNIFIIILVLVGFAVLAQLLPSTGDSATPNRPATVQTAPPQAEEPQAEPQQVAPEPEPEPEPEPVSDNEIVLPSGDTVDFLEATVFCESLVRDQLVSPRTAKFPGVFGGNEERPVKLGNSWVYNVVVDSENSFGAMLRSQWLCTLNGDNDSSSVSQVQ